MTLSRLPSKVDSRHDQPQSSGTPPLAFPSPDRRRVPTPRRCPPEIEWFANLGNKSTRRAYENALKDFMQFTGIVQAEEFRTVNRAHVVAV